MHGMSSWQGVSSARVQSTTVAVTAPVFKSIDPSRLTSSVFSPLVVRHLLTPLLPPHTWQDQDKVSSSVYSKCLLPAAGNPLQATPLRHSGISQIVLVCHLCRCFSPPGGCHHRAWTYWPRPLPTTCPNLETRPAMLMGRFTARAHTASLPPKVIKNRGIRKSLRCRNSTINTTTPAQRTAKPPVISIKSWLERYARMVAVLVSCSPEKAP